MWGPLFTNDKKCRESKPLNQAWALLSTAPVRRDGHRPVKPACIPLANIPEGVAGLRGPGKCLTVGSALAAGQGLLGWALPAPSSPHKCPPLTPTRDRFRTMINVLGDALAAGIMAHVCRKDFAQDSGTEVRAVPPSPPGHPDPSRWSRVGWAPIFHSPAGAFSQSLHAALPQFLIWYRG